MWFVGAWAKRFLKSRKLRSVHVSAHSFLSFTDGAQCKTCEGPSVCPAYQLLTVNYCWLCSASDSIIEGSAADSTLANASAVVAGTAGELIHVLPFSNSVSNRGNVYFALGNVIYSIISSALHYILMLTCTHSGVTAHECIRAEHQSTAE